MEKICLVCDHRFVVFSNSICDLTNQIIRHPDRQECPDWKEKIHDTNSNLAQKEESKAYC